MLTELNYKYDSAGNKLRVAKHRATSERKGLHHSYSSIPENPAPLVLLNGNIIQMEELNALKVKDIKTINILEPDDPIAVALYGQLGAIKGVILLTTGS